MNVALDLTLYRVLICVFFPFRNLHICLENMCILLHAFFNICISFPFIAPICLSLVYPEFLFFVDSFALYKKKLCVSSENAGRITVYLFICLFSLCARAEV